MILSSSIGSLKSILRCPRLATIPDLIWEYIRDLVDERITDLMDSERRRYIQ